MDVSGLTKGGGILLLVGVGFPPFLVQLGGEGRRGTSMLVVTTWTDPTIAYPKPELPHTPGPKLIRPSMSDTSILYHAFILIFIALWAVIT